MKTKTRIALTSLIFLTLFALPYILDTGTSYIIHLLFFFFIYLALSQAWNLVSCVGQMSLGNNAFFGLGGYITGLIWVNDLTGTGYYFDPVTMFLSGVGSAVLATAIGIPLLSRLRGDYFALGTLGLGEILRVIVMKSTAVTGGTMGMYLDASVYTSLKPHYFTAFFLALLTTSLIYFMYKSRVGLAFVAVREDETAAASNGINILTYKLLAFVVCAFFTGLCGSLYAYWIFNLTPYNMFHLSWVIYPVLMCMLGGVRTVTGPIMGALCLTGLFELARVYMPAIHPVFSGVSMIIMAMFLPGGLIRLKVFVR